MKLAEYAYTVGNSDVYDDLLKTKHKDSILFTQGKSENYDGGWVWKSPSEAKRFIEGHPQGWPPGI